MQKKSAGYGILIGVGGDDKDVAAAIWGQLVVGLLRNFKNRILEGWLSIGLKLLQWLCQGVVTLLLLQRMDALQMTSLHAETSGCPVLLSDTERMKSGQR